MIEVTLDGYRYYYHKAEDKGYWLGLAGHKGSLSRLPHCAVPTSMWSELRAKAISEGHEFVSEVKPEKKASKKRAKKTGKKSISIF